VLLSGIQTNQIVGPLDSRQKHAGMTARRKVVNQSGNYSKAALHSRWCRFAMSDSKPAVKAESTRPAAMLRDAEAKVGMKLTLTATS
jgi:hypothetical protein